MEIEPELRDCTGEHEFLYGRFGTDSFKVTDLGNEDLCELMTIAEPEISCNDQGNRIRLGNVLMEAPNGRWSFHTSRGASLIEIENPSNQDTGEVQVPLV